MCSVPGFARVGSWGDYSTSFQGAPSRANGQPNSQSRMKGSGQNT